MDELLSSLESATKGSRRLNDAVYSAVTGGVPLGLAPPYTTSLDAARALVPPGWGWKADCGLGHGFSFTVGHVGEDRLYDCPEGWGKGQTEVLAFCIAALRARDIHAKQK